MDALKRKQRVRYHTKGLFWKDTPAYRHQKNKGRERFDIGLNGRGLACINFQRYGYGFPFKYRGHMIPDGWACLYVKKKDVGKTLRELIKRDTVRSVSVARSFVNGEFNDFHFVH